MGTAFAENMFSGTKPFQPTEAFCMFPYRCSQLGSDFPSTVGPKCTITVAAVLALKEEAGR